MNESAKKSTAEVAQALAAPFEMQAIKFKPGVVAGNRALALPYVDARAIQDRLDEVLGTDGWEDEYECLSDGAVVCRLKLKIGDVWITKMDVGGPSAQPDEGDRRKAAFSDALKRAAVKFGVGRYLYRLPQQWVDYDAKTKRMVGVPKIPVPPTPKQPRPKAAPAANLPSDGVELKKRLTDYDTRLAKQGLCKPGELVAHVLAAGEKAGHPQDLTGWTGPAISLAVDETRKFEAQRRSTKLGRKEVA